MNCLLLCPLGIEFDLVKSHLSEVEEIKGFPCYVVQGNFEGKHQSYKVTILQTGAKNTDTALLTEKAIHRFEPQIAFLIGIAGGVKDVSILDVVVANEVFNYESGKVTDKGFVARPDAYRLHRDFLTLSEPLIRANDWKKRSVDTSTTATVFVGAICAGEKVVSATESEVYKNIKSNYNHCLALEMEAVGFTKALSFYPLIQTAIIRGISDLIDGKTHSDGKGNQPKAVANAAAFAFELLDQFDYSQITIPPMDIKTIAATTFSSLLPFLKKSKSIQQVSKEVSAAADTTLGTLWEKVKPIFIEEFEEETELSEDVVKEDAVLYVLKKILKKNEALKQELEVLFDKAKEEGIVANVVITNSKNVISGSTITVGGNFHQGDMNTEIKKQINNNGDGSQINIDTNHGGIKM